MKRGHLCLAWPHLGLGLAAPPWSTSPAPSSGFAPHGPSGGCPLMAGMGAGLTCRGSTTSATQIMMTTSSWDGQILGVTSP